MAKLIFYTVLALLALQGSDAHLKKVQPREAFDSNVQEVIAELKKLIHDASYRFSEVYSEVKDKVAEIEDQANISGLLIDFKQQVEQLMAQDDADACDTVTRQQVREVQKLAAVFSCKIEVNEELTGLKKQLEVLTSKVLILLQEFGRDVFKCMKESQGSQDKYNQCMEQNIFNVKQQVQIVEKEIDETFNIIEQTIPVFTDKFSACVSDKREKLVAKIEEAEETIKSCVNENNDVAPVSYKSGFAHRRESFDSNVQEVIAELKKLIHDTTYRFSEVYTEVKDKVTEIEDQANFAGLLVDFKQQIEQLMAQDGADVCDKVTRQQVREVQKLAAVFSCKIEVNEELTGLKKQLEVLTSKVGTLLQEIGRDVFNCMKESHGSQDKFNQCMEQNIFNVKQQIQVVEKEIEETFNVIEQTIPVFTDKFSACVADKREKLVAKIEEAEETIKSCVNGNNDVAPVSFKKSGFAHVADYFKYLADEINEETAHVTIQLPEGVMSLADKINEIVSKHNIEALVVEAKATVDKLMSEHENDERLCGPTAHEQLDTLAKDAQVDVEGCVSQTQQVADSLEAKFAVLADKSRALADKLNEKMLACLKDNSVNMVGFMRCMEKSTEELRDEVAQLQKEVRETLEYAMQTVEDSLKNLDVCLVKVEDNATEQTKVAIDALNTCINHADLLF